MVALPCLLSDIDPLIFLIISVQVFICVSPAWLGILHMSRIGCEYGQGIFKLYAPPNIVLWLGHNQSLAHVQNGLHRHGREAAWIGGQNWIWHLGLGAASAQVSYDAQEGKSTRPNLLVLPFLGRLALSLLGNAFFLWAFFPSFPWIIGSAEMETLGSSSVGFPCILQNKEKMIRVCGWLSYHGPSAAPFLTALYWKVAPWIDGHWDARHLGGPDGLDELQLSPWIHPRRFQQLALNKVFLDGLQPLVWSYPGCNRSARPIVANAQLTGTKCSIFHSGTLQFRMQCVGTCLLNSGTTYFGDDVLKGSVVSCYKQ